MGYEEEPSFEGYLQVKARLSRGRGEGGGSGGQLMSYEEDLSFEGYLHVRDKGVSGSRGTPHEEVEGSSFS